MHTTKPALIERPHREAWPEEYHTVQAKEKAIIEEIIAPLGLQQIIERKPLTLALDALWAGASIVTAPITYPTLRASVYFASKEKNQQSERLCPSFFFYYLSALAMHGPDKLKHDWKNGSDNYYSISKPEVFIEPDEKNPRISLFRSREGKPYTGSRVDITFPDGISINLIGGYHGIEQHDLALEEKCERDEEGMLWSKPNQRGLRYGMNREVEYVNSLFKDAELCYPCSPDAKRKLDDLLRSYEQVNN